MRALTTTSPPNACADLTAYYRHGDALRSRSVSTVVHSRQLQIPPPPPHVVADWEREISGPPGLKPGDVEALPLSRTRLRWPDLKLCVQAAIGWTQALGLPGVLSASDMALMACRGARYHHDAAQYGGFVFCNLFLSEDQGLDLHFPALELRIPLCRGIAVVFDTSQPHAVIARDSTAFDPADFPLLCNCSQVFLTWEISLDHPTVAQDLGVVFDPETTTVASLTEGQLWRQGVLAQVCPVTGAWVQ
ncbi:MAG: hypothetical protein H7293_11280 [Candidatus Saccharibacteria bacterium]|nr:hypothetical protein [Rhodoferax sp.]